MTGMIRIEIDSTELDEFSGKSQKGNDFTIRKQEAFYHGGGKYPERIKIALDEGQKAYAPGMYTVDLKASIYIDRYDNIAFGKLTLIPESSK